MTCFVAFPHYHWGPIARLIKDGSNDLSAEGMVNGIEPVRADGGQLYG